MSVSEFPKARSLRLGVEVNDFNDVDQATTEAARDAYFVSNPANLAIYDGNSSLLIRLTYLDGAELVTRFQARLAGDWVDYTPVVQGPPGEVASLANVQIGEIPFKTIDGTFAGSQMRVLEDGSILAPPGFGVESGSISFGDVLTVSEIAGFLGITNHLNDRQYTLLDVWTPRDAETAEPSFVHLIEPEFEFASQPIDTENLPDNPLIFDYTAQNTGRANAIKFRAYAAMSNVRVRVSQVSNGVALKYVPNKTAWEEELGGIDWIIGDNSFDFADSPVIIQAGQELRFEIRADSVALKGNTLGVPYFTTTIQRGVFEDVITSITYTANDVRTKLAGLTGVDRLSGYSLKENVTKVNGQDGDVTITLPGLGGQPLDATLTALAGVTFSANSIAYATAPDTFSTTTLSAFGRTLIDDADAATARGTLGLATVAATGNYNDLGNLPVLATGSYTPTATTIANVSASTTYVSKWMRVQNMVHVSGRIDIDPANAANPVTLSITLPVASNLSLESDVNGVIASRDSGGQSGGIYGSAATDVAIISYIPGSNQNRMMYYTFMYEVK